MWSHWCPTPRKHAGDTKKQRALWSKSRYYHRLYTESSLHVFPYDFGVTEISSKCAKERQFPPPENFKMAAMFRS